MRGKSTRSEGLREIKRKERDRIKGKGGPRMRRKGV